MSMGNITDIMVESRRSEVVKGDMRPSIDIFLTVPGKDQHAVGIVVTDEDVALLVREEDGQYAYIVQTPTEAGAGTQYTIAEAVAEILEVAGINVGSDGGFNTTRELTTLGVEGTDPGELDASVVDNLEELNESLTDVLEARVIDWA